VRFECSYKARKGVKECWSGNISRFIDHGSHFEIFIQSRSSILVLFGKTEYGYFACMPDFHAGCHLSSPKDTFYNTEKLVHTMKNKVDGITVAMALKAITDKVI
jgi:hypothetical protein